jgi:hypothetical protein
MEAVIDKFLFFEWGFMDFSQLQPGRKVIRQIVVSPSFAKPILPFSNVWVSSCEESRLFFNILENML